MSKTAIIEGAVAIRRNADEGGQAPLSAEAAGLAHNRYHRAARSSSAMAIVYAAMAGRELIECRKKIKHGGWEKWVEGHCEFTLMTAWRYMELAEKLKAQLANRTHVSDLEESPNLTRVLDLTKLLDRPPSELLPAEMETLLADLREATKGETLRQLYFDFGIATPPNPLGGANRLNAFLKEHYPDLVGTAMRDLPKEVEKAWRKHILDSLPTSAEKADGYRKSWREMVHNLREQGLEKKTYCFLPREELEEVYGALIDLQKELREALKK